MCRIAGPTSLLFSGLNSSRAGGCAFDALANERLLLRRDGHECIGAGTHTRRKSWLLLNDRAVPLGVSRLFGGPAADMV